VCDQKLYSSLRLFAFLFLAAFLPGHTVLAQEPVTSGTLLQSPPSMQIGQTNAPQQPDQWDSFDTLWLSLKTELTESEADYLRLSQSLDALQTEVRELKYSSMESMRLYEQSEASRVIERELCDSVESDMTKRIWSLERWLQAWRLGAFVASGLSIVLSLIIAF
jgi:hypothetical protein